MFNLKMEFQPNIHCYVTCIRVTCIHVTFIYVTCTPVTFTYATCICVAFASLCHRLQTSPNYRTLTQISPTNLRPEDVKHIKTNRSIQGN